MINPKWIKVGEDFYNLAHVVKVTVDHNQRSALLYFGPQCSVSVDGFLAAEVLGWLNHVAMGKPI